MTSRRTGKTPRSRLRPPPLTVLSAPAGPGGPIQITVIHPGYTPRCTRHRVGTGGRRHNTETTDTRANHKGGRGPQSLTGPYQIAPPQRGIRAPRERRPRPRGVRLMRSPSILPRDAEVGRVGITRPPRRRPGRRRQTDAARSKERPLPGPLKKGLERNRESKGENRGLIPSYLISDLPETHVHACQRRYRNGVRGLPSHPPVAVHSRRPRVAPSWARPHSW